MSPAHTPRPGLAALAVFMFALAAQACSSPTDDARSDPGFAMTLGATEAAVAAGSTATTSIKVTRTGGLVGPITFNVSGAPVGLTVGVTGTAVPDSSVLTFTASASIGPATIPIVVTATADGVSPRQATIALTVSAPPDGDVPDVQAVFVGAHACALSTSGTAYCWGYNGSGQLGNGETAIVTPTPVPVSGGLRFRTLSVSKVQDVTCGLSDGGAAYCWGQNFQGQLGDGTMTRRVVPTPVTGGLTFASIAVGNGHVCAVAAASGAAYCWGTSPNGALGEASPGPRLTPTLAVPGVAFQSVVAGSDYSCGLTPGGLAYCWGLGVFGQLGNGGTESSLTGVAVAGELRFRALAAGGLAACGLTMDGQAYCWGHNFYGTVGDGTSATTTGGAVRRLTPVAVVGGLTFASLSAGFETMCGVTTAGAGYCWGYNESGGVGDGSTTHRAVPVAIVGDLSFRSVAAGSGASCGVTTASVVYCWGENSNGGLGDGTVISRPTPAPVVWK